LRWSLFDQTRISYIIQQLKQANQLSTNKIFEGHSSALQEEQGQAFSSIETVGVHQNGRSISVSELARQIRQTIEQRHPLQWVSGEISGFTRATSGHWYFSLKDRDAQVRCAMFRGRNQRVSWQPQNGEAIEIYGAPTLYEARGEFQIVVDQMRPAGQGALYEAFLKLKSQLEQEGLFDSARKRALPSHPKRVGIVTSLAAAALKDVLTTLSRRAPYLSIIIYPAPVQGADAPSKLCSAIQLACHRNEVDLLILCRGGGSLEDLWAFNNEQLARTISQSPLPIISGVGHETDFTIADFVADVRAPTPTAAAELCAPSSLALQDQLNIFLGRMQRQARYALDKQEHQLQRVQTALCHSARRRLEDRSWGLDRLAHRLIHPRQAITNRKQQLESLRARLLRNHPDQTLHKLNRDVMALGERHRKSWNRTLEVRRAALQRWEQALQLLDPGQVLQRGYSLIYTSHGDLLRSAHQIQPGEVMEVVLADGSLRARAESS